MNKGWLARLAGNGPMCSFSAPLETPQPFYDEKKDQIMCYVSPRFGPHLWDLPAYMKEFPHEDSSIFKWFARCLLEGGSCVPRKRETDEGKTPSIPQHLP